MPYRVETPVNDAKTAQAIQGLSYLRHLFQGTSEGWGGAQGNWYQVQLSCIGLVPQVLLEVETIHVLVNEAERVFLRGVNTHERYDTRNSVVEEVAYVNLILKPLQNVSSIHLSESENYLGNLSNIERHITAIRLQDNLAAIVCRLPDIGKPSGGYWATANGFDIL